MLTKRPNHDRWPEIFRLAMEDFGVNHGADTSEFLPQLSIKTVLHIEVRRVKTDSVDAVLFCQPDGALIMKFLRVITLKITGSLYFLNYYLKKI